ncbi:MAG: acetate--CoA ligase [Spirochaetales bacterium]
MEAATTLKQYRETWERSVKDPDAFWGAAARDELDWMREFDRVADHDWSEGLTTWFLGGKLNVSVNCVDRHLADRPDQTALIWEKDEPGEEERITYRQLHREVCRVANALLAAGIRKGDTVALYMPMIPQAVFAMLACTRIGAVHSVVFAGFSAESLRDRINDAKCVAVITADEGLRGRKFIPLKRTVDEAVMACPSVKTIFVAKRTGNKVPFFPPRDVWLDEAMAAQRPYCPAVPMDSEDPMFLLYTSGSTGKPKGILHTTAGYLLYAKMTHQHVFGWKPGDVYACVADIGWITGHSYVVYGPLANGATTVLFEGIPTYPNAGRYWEMVDRLGITQFYTSPTAIRSIARESNDFVTKYKRTSLRVLGSVGEPINPEAWKWYHEVVGEKRCDIVDTWWQTETGGIMITPLPGVTPLKPGSATLPFYGVEPILLDEKGNLLEGNNVSGLLAIKKAWPGMSRRIHGDHQRYLATYLKPYEAVYFTGDGCRRDEDGYYWITGRVDDVINVSGHRMGTAEVESALVSYPGCAEAAVVPVPHDIKGQGIFAFVVLKDRWDETPELVGELRNEVRHHIGPIAIPDHIIVAHGLPKTRSGKIMRRILRKIAAGEYTELGDISTLADPSVVDVLIEKRKAMVELG